MLYFISFSYLLQNIFPELLSSKPPFASKYFQLRLIQKIFEHFLLGEVCSISDAHLFCAGLNLSITKVVARPAHVVLIMSKRHFSVIIIRKLKRYRLITYKSWKSHSTPGAIQGGPGGGGVGGENGQEPMVQLFLWGRNLGLPGLILYC